MFTAPSTAPKWPDYSATQNFVSGRQVCSAANSPLNRFSTSISANLVNPKVVVSLRCCCWFDIEDTGKPTDNIKAVLNVAVADENDNRK